MKPGTEILKNPNNPDRAKTPAPALIHPQDLTPNPSTNPNQKVCSFSPPPTPDGKKRTGVWKDPMPTSAHLNWLPWDRADGKPLQHSTCRSAQRNMGQSAQSPMSPSPALDQCHN
ncbi:hypothetical protein CRENBAI_021150 [Crenichthys baileyi]|uniref:Uncharacterized protein n=1 Tax=Crenichthys baileyi TaxID=28760 RepID=A0AAV9QUG9_9TELE